MKAIVVYESHWGNTQTIARAIAEGFGDGAAALSTSEATPSVVAEAELVVAGAPVMAFRLPSNRTLESISMNPGKAPAPPDLSHPPMRAWLDGLPAGNGRAASFETRLRWSPGGSTSAIDSAFQRAGYRLLATAQRFVVRGSYGPLRDGEVERARTWGAELAKAMS